VHTVLVLALVDLKLKLFLNLFAYFSREDIDVLQQRVLKEREIYQYTAQSSSLLSAIPQFAINDRFALNRDDASYTLSIEVQIPIDNVLLQVNIEQSL
jgi:Bardet-Biedl syndrome 7 protein